MSATEQKVMIVQIPSEANAERLICTRIRDANVDGWVITQMMDHNGFLVLLLERPADGDQAPIPLTADAAWLDVISGTGEPTPGEDD